MGRQIKLLMRLKLCNFCGINEYRFGKDPKKKRRFLMLTAVWMFLIVMMAGYIGLTIYGLCFMKMGELVPKVTAVAIAVMTLFFSFFKAGSVIFDQKTYELQIALPISKTAIVVSRFLSMYVSNLLLSLGIMAMAMIIYGALEKPQISFYIYGIIGAFFLPILPLTIATILGAGITAISSGWRHKNLISTGLTLALVIGIFGGSTLLSSQDESQLMQSLGNMAQTLEDQVAHIYPPAVWLGNVMTQGKVSGLFLLLAASIVPFLLMVLILQKYFQKICSALQTTYKAGNYQMKELSTHSLLKSLWIRELRHYFSSTIYVTNTMVGYILMVVIAGALLFTGLDKLNEMLGISGISLAAVPFLLGAMPAMMPLTAASISMEGKQWWLLQTLPIPKRTMIFSKILADLTVVFPFYLLAEVLVCIAVKPQGAMLLWYLLIPAVYIVGSAFVGLFVNMKFPVLNWESETQVVKQGAATFLTMLVAMVAVVIPIGIIIALKL